MRDRVERVQRKIWSTVGQLKNRAIADTKADLHDGKRWLREDARQGVAVAFENALGFWVAILLTALIVSIGMVITDLATAGFEVAVIANVIPNFLLEYVAVFGFLITLTGGLAMFGVMAATVLRILVWIRDTLIYHWNQNTPPYTKTETDSDSATREPSAEAIERAKEKTVAYFMSGSIWFLVISSTLLLIEEYAAGLLYGVTSNPQLGSIGEVLNTGFFVIDVEGLIFEFAPNTSQTEIVLFMLLFVIPGVWFAFFGRNLLLLTETMVHESVKRVQENGLISRAGFELAALSLWFLGAIVAAALDLFSG